MRLVLPTSDDGADREYALDVANASLITLDELTELKRATNIGLDTVIRGFRFLPTIASVSKDVVAIALSENLDLMQAYRALIWLARYRAGDRSKDGLPLTAADAVDFPIAKVGFVVEPGDEVEEDESANPQTPPAAGSQATGGGSKPTPTRGRSPKTSVRKS